MNFGNSSKFRSSSARFSAVAWAAMLPFTIAFATALRSFAHSASTRSPAREPSASSLFWRARIASTLSSSRSAGLALRITVRRSLPRPASPAPNSFRMIAKRSRYGRRITLRIRSSPTGVTVLDTGSRYWPAPSWPSGILLQRRWGRIALRPRLGRDALDELLADHRLEPDLALGVAAEVLEARLVDLQHDRRRACRRSPRARRRSPPSRPRSSRPRPGSRTQRCRRSRGPCSHRRRRPPAPTPTTSAMSTPTTASAMISRCLKSYSSRSSRPHGPTGLWLGSQSPAVSLPSSVNGLEPSGAGCVAAPGQKRLPPRS